MTKEILIRIISIVAPLALVVMANGTPWSSECEYSRVGAEYIAQREYSRVDAEYIAKTVWGEARSCELTEQAAVIWCILNRVDDSRFPNTIQAVITQPYQFAGYSASHPLDGDILRLVYDVLARWTIEPQCVGDIGRVLPAEYLYFSGDGAHNRFRVNWNSGTAWGWSLVSPY